MSSVPQSPPRLDPVAKLPLELSLLIWSYLDHQTLLKASMTSAAWYQLCRDPYLWRQLYLEARYNPGDTIGTARLSDPFASSFHNSTQLDWRNLYKQRARLKDNWRAGRFVNFQLPHPDYSQEGHTADIYAIQMCGKYLVTGSLDETIRIWNLETHRLVGGPLLGHQGGVLCLQFDPREDEDIILSGGLSGELISWRFSTRTAIEKLSAAHRAAVTSIKFDEQLLITSSADRTIKIWDRRTMCGVEHDRAKSPILPLATMTGHLGSVNAIDFSGDTLVSASADRTLKVWSISQGVCLRTIEEPRSVACVNFNGESIISGGRHKSIAIYNDFTEPRRDRLFGHGDLVRTVKARFGQGSIGVIASGSYDGAVIIWVKTAEGEWNPRRLNVHKTAGSFDSVSASPNRSGSSQIAPRDHQTASSICQTSSGGVRAQENQTHGSMGRRRSRNGVRARLDRAGSVDASSASCIFGLDFDDQRLACCSDGPTIIGWDLVNDNPDIMSCCLGLPKRVQGGMEQNLSAAWDLRRSYPRSRKESMGMSSKTGGEVCEYRDREPSNSLRPIYTSAQLKTRSGRISKGPQRLGFG